MEMRRLGVNVGVFLCFFLLCNLHKKRFQRVMQYYYAHVDLRRMVVGGGDTRTSGVTIGA